MSTQGDAASMTRVLPEEGCAMTAETERLARASMVTTGDSVSTRWVRLALLLLAHSHHLQLSVFVPE